MYLIGPERAKNIFENEVASDFVFILKMRKNPQNFGSQTCRIDFEPVRAFFILLPSLGSGNWKRG